MSTKLRANIELGLNIIVVAALIVVTAVVIKRYVFSGVQQAPRVAVGEQLRVPEVDWKQNQKTLVFFLMENCFYCESSAPFYRQLIEEASKHNVKSLAILPHPIEAGRKYVQHLNLPIENVQNGLFSSYKVPGTPTVLFVDHDGTVRGVWIGANPGREKQMKDELTGLFNAGI